MFGPRQKLVSPPRHHASLRRAAKGFTITARFVRQGFTPVEIYGPRAMPSIAPLS